MAINTNTPLTHAEYLAAVIALGRANGYSLGHEDCHGAFIVEPYSDHNAAWLADAIVEPYEEGTDEEVDYHNGHDARSFGYCRDSDRSVAWLRGWDYVSPNRNKEK